MKKMEQQTAEAFKDNSHKILAELQKASASYGPMNSNHEAYGIILEELDEFWDEVKRNDTVAAREEIVQVAAMCYRYLQDSEYWK